MISISSRPNSPPSPACGLSPLTAIFALAMPSRLSAASAARIVRATFSRVISAMRLAHAAVQGAMGDPGVAEAQHHVDAALVGAGLPRHERRMAVEFDAGLRDRGLVLRRRHHRIDLARHRGLHGGGAERDRGAAADRADDAEAERRRFRLRAGQHVHCVERIDARKPWRGARAKPDRRPGSDRTPPAPPDRARP